MYNYYNYNDFAIVVHIYNIFFGIAINAFMIENLIIVCLQNKTYI